MDIRIFEEEDYKAVSEIYIQGVETGTAVFNRNCPSWDEWDSSHLKACRFVAVSDEKVVGWSALTPISNRCVDSGVAEVSVYIASNYRGCGVGKALLNTMIDASEKEGFWTLQAGILQDNIASIRLCESCGLRMVGYRERIGRDFNGVWHNTILMERRSKAVESGGCCCGK